MDLPRKAMIVFPPQPKNGTRPALHVYGGMVPTEDGVKVACVACKRLLSAVQWAEDCKVVTAEDLGEET